MILTAIVKCIMSCRKANQALRCQGENVVVLHPAAETNEMVCLGKRKEQIILFCYHQEGIFPSQCIFGPRGTFISAHQLQNN